MLSVKQLSILEVTVWNIMEGLRSNVSYVSYFCREYWGASGSRAQLSLDRLDWGPRLKQQVQLASILESLSLAAASRLCSGTMQEVSVAIRSRLSNLFYYIHENTLVLMDLVRQRWQHEVQHNGADVEEINCLNFEILIHVNRYRQLRKGEHVMALRQHNEMILNIVRQLCRAGSGFASTGAGFSVGRGGAKQGSPRLAGSNRGAKSPPAHHAGVLGAVIEILSSSTPLDRLRPRNIRTSMLAHMRFQPLLNLDGNDANCPWPQQDPYERFGSENLGQDGPIIWFEPLPPMMADLERATKLPPLEDPGTYTLVLDLDETLVHYFELNGCGNYGIRPGMHEFLQRMNGLGYELVIFTAATQDYADWVIDQIDPDRLVQHRLYRQHALPWGPLFTKDLSRLGRNLDTTLIIDNVQENFMLQPNNGIFIYTWYDDPEDTALFELTPLLEELVTTKAIVPDILDKYRDQIPQWAGFGPCMEPVSGCSDLDASVGGGHSQYDSAASLHGQTEPANEYYEQQAAGTHPHHGGPYQVQQVGTYQVAQAQPGTPSNQYTADVGQTSHWGQPLQAQASAQPLQAGAHMQPPKQGQGYMQAATAPAFATGVSGPCQAGPCQAGPYQVTHTPQPQPMATQPRPAFSGAAGPYQAPMPQQRR